MDVKKLNGRMLSHNFGYCLLCLWFILPTFGFCSNLGLLLLTSHVPVPYIKTMARF